MIIKEKTFTGHTVITKEIPLDQTVLFDIETTGFVAEKSYIYLIGCCYYKEDTWNLIQWFAESPTEEIEILNAFIGFIKDFSICIHYNGTTFDLPYITKKCAKHNLSFAFDGLKSIDLYRIATSLKSILHLNSYTQKSVEQAFNITRKDTYTGGELIQIYANYVGIARLEQLQKREQTSNPNHTVTTTLQPKETADDLLQLLLLHNEEDIIGLQALLVLLEYHNLLDGNYHVESISLTRDNCICFTLRLFQSLPSSFCCTECGIKLSASDTSCAIHVPLYEGTLKHFIKDYRNYYYLPYEDTIIHKSIAGSMDKKYRVSAKKEQCFFKKTSLFLPQWKQSFEPVFQMEYTSKNFYFECTDECLQDEEFLHQYTKQLIQYALK